MSIYFCPEFALAGTVEAANGAQPLIPFSPDAFEASVTVGSQWRLTAAQGLRMNDHYIARPQGGQERADWLKALRHYRDQVRSGRAGGIIELNGTVGWIKFAPPLMRALDLRPGERLRYAIEVRHLAGNNRFCFTFDLQERANDITFIDWTGVNGVVTVPGDGQWHRFEPEVTVPGFDREKYKLLPVVGLDPSVKEPQGQMEVRLIDVKIDDGARMKALAKAARELPRALDRSVYNRPENDWLAGAYTCHFSFLYDQSLIDHENGAYRTAAFLDEGRREFGGYDALLLWQAYPRLGFDERSQFDFYRDLPGGLEGVAALVREAHGRGVKVFTNYNPWDIGTTRASHDDEEMLAELVRQTGFDGIFLDTLPGSSASLRHTLEKARPGIALCPEASPVIQQLPLCNASWAQWLQDPVPPGLLHLKFIEPRHMQYQIRRWNLSHRGELRTAFFNGSGMMVWENIFGAFNPWSAQDRRLWRRAVPILRRYRVNFTSDAWEPFWPTLEKGVFAHGWPGAGATVYTLIREDEGNPLDPQMRPLGVPLLEVPCSAETVFFDLWNGVPLEAERAGDKARIKGSLDRASGLGCVLAIERDKVDQGLLDFLAAQRKEALEPAPKADPRNDARPVLEPQPVTRTALASPDKVPEGMVYVPGGERRFHLAHQRGECGCYPDPETPADLWENYTWGNLFTSTLTHEIGPLRIEPFYIDEAAVTNRQYEQFMKASGYRPRHTQNFLKHWPGGVMPAELADHPVVYVDLDDARAYARWAGKRLPTEIEWQLAAQGTDARRWPWGNEFDAKRVNPGGRTLPARALPEGRSPYGCYQMAGNVWELNESLRDDGHTRFLILRGGSYLKVAGSGWYAASGPQPCDTHSKFLLLWPGLDRCSTIGFRCVVDAAPQKP